MNFDTMFPSKYWKAFDLDDEPHVLQIKGINTEKMNDGAMKPVVYFKGSNRGLVLNLTNGRVLADLYGADTDDWIGQYIALVASTTDFQGRTVDCIRLRPAKTKKAEPASKPVFAADDEAVEF